jgi:hypothetical protein
MHEVKEHMFLTKGDALVWQQLCHIKTFCIMSQGFKTN